MAKKKTIRTIRRNARPMPEQDPQVRAKNFEEVAAATASKTRCANPSAA